MTKPTDTTTDTTIGQRLQVLAEEIAKSANRAAQHNAKAAKMLREAKRLLIKHGKWGAWLKENFSFTQSPIGGYHYIYRSNGRKVISTPFILRSLLPHRPPRRAHLRRSRNSG